MFTDVHYFSIMAVKRIEQTAERNFRNNSALQHMLSTAVSSTRNSNYKLTGMSFLKQQCNGKAPIKCSVVELYIVDNTGKYTLTVASKFPVVYTAYGTLKLIEWLNRPDRDKLKIIDDAEDFASIWVKDAALDQLNPSKLKNTEGSDVIKLYRVNGKSFHPYCANISGNCTYFPSWDVPDEYKDRYNSIVYAMLETNTAVYVFVFGMKQRCGHGDIKMLIKAIHDGLKKL